MMRLHKPVKNERIESLSHRFRLNVLVVLVILLSSLLICRLAYLQIAQFKRYATLSLKNQMNVIPLAPTRGIITDKNGIVLAENIPAYGLEIIPERVKNLSQTISRLRILLPAITEDDIESFTRLRKQNRSFVPLPLKLKLNQEEVAIFAINQYKFPGVSIKARLIRYYPFREITAHLLGYVGRVNAKELEEVDPINYRATNFIGKTGIEKFYERVLHGEIGYQQVETDVNGRVLRILHKKNSVTGAKLSLTVDVRLQEAAYHALKNKRGAAVVMNVKGGDVLAMVSSPTFDPNLFVNGIDTISYNKLLNAPDKPLYNRATNGLYPPASTIKPFIGLAGLQNNLIDAKYSIYDRGWFNPPGVTHIYHDWKKTGHGFINLKRAIAVSCDTYFYQLGHRLGITAIEEMLWKFGFGQLTHIDLNEEAAGVLPSKQWKIIAKGVPWYLGDTIITSIGQGFMLASPLQLANATAALSKKGKRYRPHLLDKIQNEKEIKGYRVSEQYPLTLQDKNYWSIISEAMQAVITSKEGTGYRFGITKRYSVAAKTGTAQVVGNKQYEKIKYEAIPELLRDHSLFIAFAPIEKPKIAVAVIVENDFVAANIARKIMDAYFDNHAEASKK